MIVDVLMSDDVELDENSVWNGTRNGLTSVSYLARADESPLAIDFSASSRMAVRSTNAVEVLGPNRSASCLYCGSDASDVPSVVSRTCLTKAGPVPMTTTSSVTA